MTIESVLRLENVHKSFGETHVLKGVSLTIQPRDVVVLVGPSGTGKSTLLRCINLLSPPTQGKIWLEAQEITTPSVNQDKVRQRIGMVFQDFNLFTHLTALGNVMVGLTRVRKMHKKEAYDLAMLELDASVWWIAPTTIRRNSPAGRSSAWPSPARWAWIPTSCSSTSQPRRLTRS
jgi:ABC-type polar amino acid transport system ATPase subunit